MVGKQIILSECRSTVTRDNFVKKIFSKTSENKELVARARCQENQLKLLQNNNKDIQKNLKKFLSEIKLQKDGNESFGSSVESLSLLKTQNDMLEKKLSSVIDLLQDSLNSVDVVQVHSTSELTFEYFLSKFYLTFIATNNAKFKKYNM